MKIKSAIPTGEKLLYLLCVVLVVVGVGFIGTRYVQISQYNHEIQKVKGDIQTAQKTNGTLQLKIKEMSSPERIEAVARELGMNPTPGAVSVVAGHANKQAAATENNNRGKNNYTAKKDN